MLKKAVCMLAACVVGLGLFCGCGDTPQGTFYTLQEAYDNGYLTQEDLMSIAYYHNGGREGNEEIMAEDYAPLPKNPEVLSEEIRAGIIQTFWDDHFSQSNPYNITLDDIGFRYYGSYNHCIAVRMGCSNVATDVYWEYEIHDVLFAYLYQFSIVDEFIQIWVQN